MIRETEDYLNQRLNGRREGGRPDERTSAKLDPRGNHCDRRQMRPHGLADEIVSVRTGPTWATFVEIRPDRRGVVDNQRVQAVYDRLAALARDRSVGDIVIGLQHVEVMTAGLMSALASIKPRLQCQRRMLLLTGLRPGVAQLLRGTELKQDVYDYDGRLVTSDCDW
jgi:anti-anti-sigma regulatory factor